MPPTFEDVYGEKYLLLTTFTEDGRPKPTPIWGVADGDKLVIITADGSWKTRRWHAWWWVPQALVCGGIDKMDPAIEVTAAPG